MSICGRYYYVNSAGQIWCITRNPDFTYTKLQITTLPANMYARDIGAGTYNGNDRLWVRFRNAAGNHLICFAEYAGSGSSVIDGSAGWYYCDLFGGAPKCVATSPYDAYLGISISGYYGAPFPTGGK